VANASVAGVAGIWQKLRRRKVVQWGFAYCAAAWGLLQGLEYATATFHWPEPIQQLATLALLIGLPIALVLAWYHGDRGEQHFQRAELALIALLTVAGGIVIWRYEPATEVASRVDAASPATASRASTDPRPSIAVLPFENRSRLEDDAYFVDGIHDDILTQLSKVSALRVISRTSVEQFRDTKLSSREIAEKLGVTRVLEGGVQRAGDRVRINVQLIDAGTEAHLWAERYDRELTVANLFEIQSELADAISTALQAALTPAERLRMSARPTGSLEAWEAYQRGRREIEKRTSASLVEAERLFQQAIDHDPEFALAYVGRASSVTLQEAWEVTASGRSKEQSLALADELIKRALALSPDLPEAITQAAGMADNSDDHSRSERLFQRAIALDPNYAIAHHSYGRLLVELGRNEEALRQYDLALELDPVSPIILWHSVETLFALDRVGDALARLRKTLEIDPAFPQAYLTVGGIAAVDYGRLDIGIPWAEKAASLDPGSPVWATFVAGMYLRLGDDDSANRWLQPALQHGDRSARAHAVAAEFYLYRGDHAASEKHARTAESLSGDVKLLDDANLRRGDYAAARARYAERSPALLATKSPEIDELALALEAKDLACVLQHTGEEERARMLLERSAAYFRTSRSDLDGYGIHLVAVHALRGDSVKALATLRDSTAGNLVRGGFHNFGWRYYRDFDPTLASIRGEPEFKAAFARIEAEMAAQRARLAVRPKDAPLEFEQVEKLVAAGPPANEPT
jgi:TolB-like protein/Tfp pilus assembly protein PilF